jgi:hypothetical protein
VLSPQDRNKRRALIVRRWAAYRVGQAQREIWRKRREAQGAVDLDEGSEGSDDGDLLAELPESLIR